MEFDTSVKLNIYKTIAETAHVPTAVEVAQALNVSIEQVDAAFKSLHQKRLLVPEPGDPSRIRMAPPFSGIETAFRVDVQAKSYYGNCAWDALGIPAALHQDAIVNASDAQSGEPITLRVTNGRPEPEPCVIHFAVPAAHWWDDVIYT